MTLANDLSALEHIHLVARDDERNVRREYLIEQSPDLFGYTIVEWCWGRIGTAGQRRRAGFATKPEAERLVRGLLGRRRSALRRIGVAYQCQ